MHYKDTDIVYAVREYRTPGARRTVLFFSPFGVRAWQLALPGMPLRVLRRNGFDVIVYSYRAAILTQSLKLTMVNMQSIIEDADRRIAAIDPAVEVSCFGSSMGTVLAANVAARNLRIKKVILNLSYADIGDHIINLPGIRSIPARLLRRYIATAGSPENLRAAFKPYSPLTLAPKLRGKSLLVYSSRDDAVLKREHTVQLHEALRDAGVAFIHYENKRGGHYACILLNYLRYERWLRFLQSD